ncbi:hypothetical protein TVAG_069580 [Trichomonas vaginalis G3]|uniref:Uncharacterized protein n=1 Tax=Trichomonas vaginalis (strain ATCC PRA-98 / G3) TaxID=412133 RepID=A2ELB1_TRIV3|nr:hypothetical protein TVAGG3_0003650 [Trichomonas vaginalis G3]EAY06588.1 hypothetical protein TVAG_069580 [Trichomonas vaginalis G3]KAI5538775.1 hypothetical protein TVAGG3_0003650 [Trichomonas vaginalis G3]|eukprot:XP_001318811.1 hypothetical protein [Trichomonas vaginalis G3]
MTKKPLKGSKKTPEPENSDETELDSDIFDIPCAFDTEKYFTIPDPDNIIRTNMVYADQNEEIRMKNAFLVLYATLLNKLRKNNKEDDRSRQAVGNLIATAFIQGVFDENEILKRFDKTFTLDPSQ